MLILWEGEEEKEEEKSVNPMGGGRGERGRGEVWQSYGRGNRRKRTSPFSHFPWCLKWDPMMRPEASFNESTFSSVTPDPIRILDELEERFSFRS